MGSGTWRNTIFFEKVSALWGGYSAFKKSTLGYDFDALEVSDFNKE